MAPTSSFGLSFPSIREAQLSGTFDVDQNQNRPRQISGLQTLRKTGPATGCRTEAEFAGTGIRLNSRQGDRAYRTRLDAAFD